MSVFTLSVALAAALLRPVLIIAGAGLIARHLWRSRYRPARRRIAAASFTVSARMDGERWPGARRADSSQRQHGVGVPC